MLSVRRSECIEAWGPRHPPQNTLRYNLPAGRSLRVSGLRSWDNSTRKTRSHRLSIAPQKPNYFADDD
ncbi:MAG: hypothetical protein ACYC0V_17895, partial [Armatimonadota bacterium]